MVERQEYGWLIFQIAVQFFSRIWKQLKAEAEACRIRSLERHSIDGLSE